jgi:uncharacterized membrane protein YjfL (UPF0719 family)
MGVATSAVLSSIVFAAIGVVIFVLAFWLLDRATPYRLWEEINEKNNVALAILVGSAMIGIAMIISAAIHG